MSDRILVISPRYWPEKTKISDICEGFAERGYGVDVICGQPSFPAGRFFKGYHSYGHSEERHKGVRLLRHFETRRGNGTAFRIMLNYLVSSFAACRKLGKVRRIRYDAVLVYQTSPVMSCTAGLRAGKKRNIPVVTYAVDIWPDSLYREIDMQSPLLRRIFRRISEKKYRASDVIATPLRQVVQHFVKDLDIHPGRVRCIAQGPDSVAAFTGADTQIRERYFGSFNIVTVDEMLEKQDHDTVLKCAEMIRNTGLISIRIVLVCSVKAEKLKKEIFRRGLGDILFVEDEQETADISGYYNIADAFLSCERPSAGDVYTFPDDLITFMSCARPVIFAGDGEGRSIVRDAGCGRVIDPEDPEALFGAVMDLYRSRKQDLERMGDAAAGFQKKYYSTDACIDGLLDAMFGNSKDAEDGFIINSSPNIIRADDLFEDRDE